MFEEIKIYRKDCKQRVQASTDQSAIIARPHARLREIGFFAVQVDVFGPGSAP